MKNWPSQLLPIALLALLAAMTFWLRQTVDNSTPPPPRAVTHDPDGIAENFVIRRFDRSGQLKYRLTAPFFEHYPDDDSSAVRSPVLVAYRDGASALTVSADHADLTSKGETVVLRDNVRVARPATGGRPEMVARMPELTVKPDAGTAATDAPVEITQGASWITGVGMTLDNNTATLELLSQVRGQYIRPSAQP